MIRLLVTGGRDYRNKDFVKRTLDFFHNHTIHKITCLIHGDADGADSLADEWAIENGFSLDGEPRLIREPANWELGGRAAGVIRNQRMLDLHKPNLVTAFPGGKGTADMISRARNAGLLVFLAADKRDAENLKPYTP